MDAWATRVHYAPHGSGGGIVSWIMHGFGWSLGSHAGGAVAALLGPGGLIALVAVVGLVWIASRFRQRRRR